MPKLTRIRALLALAGCAILGACASTSHVTAFQEAMIAPAPRSLALAIDPDETYPFGIARDAVAAAAARAGFVIGGDTPARYRLALTAAAGSSDAGSFLPASGSGASPDWVARPDHNWRARFAGGRLLRVTAVLVDVSLNREVWRGTGTLRTANPQVEAPALAGEVLAKLPRG